MKTIFAFSMLFLLGQALWAFPSQPTDPADPGSATSTTTFEKKALRISGRDVTVYRPTNAAGPVPVVVFGHGQAIDINGYTETFEHLAHRGVAVIFPMYDSGFFDQDWQRMAQDFNRLTEQALAQFPKDLDSSQVVFSGHSKGGYVALMAAGLTEAKVRPRSIVLFAPAGKDAELIKTLPSSAPLTVVWGEKDSIISKQLQMDIYNQAPSLHKQLIEVHSYPDLAADHFLILSKSYFFGGRNGVSAFHYYGVWKWLLGAAWDLQDQGRVDNPYIYGDQTASSGDPQIKHSVLRNW